MPNPFPPTVDLALYVRTDPEEMLVYWVRSASRASIEHRVDLAAYDGNGECGCERFEFGLRPALERGEEGRRSLECRHIREAKGVFARQMLRKLIAEAKRQRKIRTAEKRSAFKAPPRPATQNTETERPVVSGTTCLACNKEACYKQDIEIVQVFHGRPMRVRSSMWVCSNCGLKFIRSDEDAQKLLDAVKKEASRERATS